MARRAGYIGRFGERITVTLDARHLLMLAGQWEPGFVVIHLGRLPAFRRVTRLAVGVPARMICRRWLVARFAQRRSGLGEWIAVTLVARHLLVLADQWEVGLVVIHLGRLPAFWRVTCLAVGVPTGVISRGRLVAGFAQSRRRFGEWVAVTLDTCHLLMLAG
jgi:hypothetical protein